MILEETITLNNGVELPRLGLGTWEIADGDAAQAVRDAVEIGYRHVDTARDYMNEEGVGEGVRTCGIPREQMFVTSKISAFAKDYDAAKEQIEASLSATGLDYLDLMLIHAPEPWTEYREGKHFFKENLEVWRALEEAYEAGKLRAIGVANFEREDLENLFDHAGIRPMVNQVLCHVSNTPTDLISFCRANDVAVEAYSPIAHGVMLRNPALAAMAERYGVSAARLCIRYCLQLGTIALPKTANPAHMADNANVDFAISDEDMDALRAFAPIESYEEFGHFPVFGGKMTL